MAIVVRLKHLKKLGDGRWEYRRRVPDSLRDAAGKTEWKRVIRAETEKEMLRQHRLVEAAYDRDMTEAGKLTPTGGAKLTPREQWEVALVEAERLASGVSGIDDETEARSLVADVIADKLSPMMRLALVAPDAEPPKRTLQDARNIYVQERLKGGVTVADKKAVVRLDRVMRKAKEAGLSPLTALDSLTREQARKVRDHMLAHVKKSGSQVAPASVLRELNLLKAVISKGLREYDLTGKAANPFEQLHIEGATGESAIMGAEERRRQALPAEVKAGMRDRLSGDLLLIWRLLEGTGCRLAEITGLQVEDVFLSPADDLPPHVKVRWSETRRLKTLTSIRPVPLIGDALGAAREALNAASGSPALFPAYGRDGGPDAASAALMKHLRKLTQDHRHVVYSLRHEIKDKMRVAEVEKAAQDIVLGHASARISEGYGGDKGRLAVGERALRAALGLHDKEGA